MSIRPLSQLDDLGNSLKPVCTHRHDARRQLRAASTPLAEVAESVGREWVSRNSGGSYRVVSLDSGSYSTELSFQPQVPEEAVFSVILHDKATGYEDMFVSDPGPLGWAPQGGERGATGYSWSVFPGYTASGEAEYGAGIPPEIVTALSEFTPEQEEDYWSEGVVARRRNEKTISGEFVDPNDIQMGGGGPKTQGGQIRADAAYDETEDWGSIVTVQTGDRIRFTGGGKVMVRNSDQSMQISEGTEGVVAETFYAGGGNDGFAVTLDTGESVEVSTSPGNIYNDPKLDWVKVGMLMSAVAFEHRVLSEMHKSSDKRIASFREGDRIRFTQDCQSYDLYAEVDDPRKGLIIIPAGTEGVITKMYYIQGFDVRLDTGEFVGIGVDVDAPIGMWEKVGSKTAEHPSTDDPYEDVEARYAARSWRVDRNNFRQSNRICCAGAAVEVYGVGPVGEASAYLFAPAGEPTGDSEIDALSDFTFQWSVSLLTPDDPAAVAEGADILQGMYASLSKNTATLTTFYFDSEGAARTAISTLASHFNMKNIRSGKRIRSVWGPFWNIDFWWEDSSGLRTVESGMIVAQDSMDRAIEKVKNRIDQGNGLFSAKWNQNPDGTWSKDAGNGRKVVLRPYDKMYEDLDTAEYENPGSHYE